MRRPDVKRLYQSLTASEITWWQTYYALEPSLDQRIDYLIASIVQMTHNVVADKKHQKPLKDFLLKFQNDEQLKKPAWQYQRDLMLMIATTQNNMVESGQKEQ